MTLGHLRVSLPLLLTAALLLFVAPAGAATDLWTPIGPGGGEVRALVAAPSNPDVLYTGTQGGGVFKSVDGAATWTSVNSGLTNLVVLALAVHPRNPSIVYAGTLGGGVFKTADGGATWRRLPFPYPYAFSLAIDPRKPSTVYAGTTGRGVFKSTDGGASWLPVNRTLREAVVRSIAIHPRRSSIVYIAVEGGPRLGVFKSTDGGATWRAMNNGLPEFASEYGVFAVVLDPSDPDTLYTEPIGGGVYRSTDGGMSWTRTQMGGFFPIAVGPSGLLWAGPYQKSYDKGDTVIRTRWPLSLGSETLALDPRNANVVYAGYIFAGLAKTVDGGATWQTRNQGLWASTIATLAVAPDRPSQIYADAVGQGFFRTWNGGTTWRMPNHSPNLEITQLAIDTVTPSTLYGVINGYDLEKSTDRGASWVHLQVADPNCLEILDIAVDPVEPANVYVGGTVRNGRCPEGCYAFRSTDAGESWACMSAAGGASLLEIDPRDPSILYAFNGHLLKSVDRGIQWLQVGQGLPESLLSLAVDPSATSTLYAGTREGVYKSVDGGATWQQSSAGLPAGHIAALVIDPRDSSVVYAGLADINRDGTPTPGIARGNIGVYRSTDGGASWSRFGQGLPTARFNGLLAIDPAAPYTLYAGTEDGGVYKIATVP